MSEEPDIDALLRRHRPLIHMIARRWHCGRIDAEEIDQIGRLAIWKSLLVLQEKPQYQFSTILCRMVKHELRDWYRGICGVLTLPRRVYSNDATARNENLFCGISLDDENNACLHNSLIAAKDELAESEWRLSCDAFWRCVKSLVTEQEYALLEFLYRGRSEPARLKDAARVFRLSETRIGQIHRSAIQKIAGFCRRNASFKQALVDMLSG